MIDTTKPTMTKIGTAKHSVIARWSDLATGNPHLQPVHNVYVRDAKGLEADMHERFKDVRVRAGEAGGPREWFLVHWLEAARALERRAREAYGWPGDPAA